MPDQIERMAELSVARGCGFAAFATALLFIGTMPASLSLAFTIAGVAALLTSAVLLLKAALAGRRPYQHTELWGMLKAHERPEPAVAQLVIPRVLHATFLRFAQQAALIAAVMFVCAVVGRGFLR